MLLLKSGTLEDLQNGEDPFAHCNTVLVTDAMMLRQRIEDGSVVDVPLMRSTASGTSHLKDRQVVRHASRNLVMIGDVAYEAELPETIRSSRTGRIHPRTGQSTMIV